jgi:DNA-binding NtrC family response regulator
LVVEDQTDARLSLQQLLEMALGLEVDTAENGVQALQMLSQRPYSLMVTDLRMPQMSGMKLIEQVREKDIPVTIIVTTGHGSIKEAVEAMRLGAYDFLVKPADPQHLCLMIQRALNERGLRDEVAALRAQLNERHSFQNVLSKHPKMMEVFDLIGHVAETISTILVAGETGTGKEMVAKAIHQASARFRPGPFVAVNCAALPETLLESELFGHEKGAFTGASTLRRGRFEQAHQGTLFLDEVGDVPLAMQVKLLRVLQEHKIERVGANEQLDLDVRVIAATNRSLEKMVEEGTFREDLFYRLNVIRIDLPPLRDRSEDIPLLATHFVRKYARPGHEPTISPEAMQLLLTHSWPGNVRQLENAIERACVTNREGVIQPHHLPPDIGKKPKSKSLFHVDLSRTLPEQLAELTALFEERYLRRALRRTHGHVGRCAKISGLSRRSITDKIAHYKIDKKEYKSGEEPD